MILAGSVTARAQEPVWPSGAYLGASLGALGLEVTEIDDHTSPPSHAVFSGGPEWGIAGTLFAGYDVRIAPKYLVGGFVNVEGSSAEVTLVSPGGDVNHVREQYAVFLGLRLAYLTTPDLMLYGQGGYTLGNFSFDYSNVYSRTEAFDGWFVGAGLEQKLDGPWSIRLEYRYAQYGKQVVGAVAAPPDVETHTIEPETQSIQVGLTYRFSGN